ncbi:HAD family hydrolase [Pseudomonas sp. ICMP 561]|uniref:HAD family hydrolase n=1 Tax=Pseudomonas sp. ICMP 561 TaxID=1718918 RepID=UPI000C07008B|nr:HAD family hydrolase [Pseudomonas sp. ICMP 561]PHN25163.1 hydrolase [Pseudomonas sp. ICMP 561]
MYPRAILFDLDNTLTNRAFSILRYAKVFLTDFGHQMKFVTLDDIGKLILREDNGGYLSPESKFTSIREAVGQTLAHDLPWLAPKAPQVLINHWMNHFPSATVQMPGALDLILELESRDIKVGVISNGAERSRRQTIAALPFAKSVSTAISSEAFGMAKPASDIFRAGAAQLGFLPEQCWFVGDHPLNDYQGAKAAGMYAVWFQGFHSWPEGIIPAESSITSLDELPNLISQCSPGLGAR